MENIVGWSVALVGDVFDLEELPKWLDHGDAEVVAEASRYYLRSDLFPIDGDPAEIRRVAQELVDIINGLARLQWPEFQPVTIGEIERRNADGTTSHHEYVTERVRVRDKLTVAATDRDGNPVPPPDQGRLSGWLHVSIAEGMVQRSLGYVSKPEISWSDLYRALEVVEEDVGGAIYEQGWASKGEIGRFTHTANSVSVLGQAARHGRDRAEPPARPMDFHVARQLVLRIIRRWLESKVAA